MSNTVWLSGVGGVLLVWTAVALSGRPLDVLCDGRLLAAFLLFLCAWAGGWLSARPESPGRANADRASQIPGEAADQDWRGELRPGEGGLMRAVVGQWRRAGEWTGLYAVNLIVLVIVGGLDTVRAGRLGALCGVAVVWAVGLAACTYPARLGPVLLRGARAVALCQMFPVLQFVSSAYAFQAWYAVGGTASRGGLVSEAGGFAVVLMTAQPLLSAAFVFGGGHRLLAEWWGDDD